MTILAYDRTGILTFWLISGALYRMSHWPLSSPLLSTPSSPPPSPFLSLLHTMVPENRRSKFSSWLSPNCHVTCWKSPSLRLSVYPKERIGLKGHRNSDNFMCSLNPLIFFLGIWEDYIFQPMLYYFGPGDWIWASRRVESNTAHREAWSETTLLTPLLLLRWPWRPQTEAGSLTGCRITVWSSRPSPWLHAPSSYLLPWTMTWKHKTIITLLRVKDGYFQQAAHSKETFQIHFSYNALRFY